MSVAVLCASVDSIYKQFDGVEVYDIARDVRTFNGGMPVVAHPPCRAWSAYCGHQAKPLPGERELGPLCVDWLRQCGGVLEHPAHSRLWDFCDLPQPGGKPKNGFFALKVNQSWWGDTRIKRTWLLIYGMKLSEVPPIPFRLHDAIDAERWNVLSKRKRSATVPAFAEWLVTLARGCKV